MAIIEVSIQFATSSALQKRRKPVRYQLAIYHSQNGPDPLVTFVKNDGSKWQSGGHQIQFLMRWQGLVAGSEGKV